MAQVDLNVLSDTVDRNECTALYYYYYCYSNGETVEGKKKIDCCLFGLILLAE